MLVIRLKRVGRKNLAVFRIVVQDSRWSAKSGKIVEQLGSYNPHDKKLVIDKTKTELFLKNGAHPSERMVLLLKKEGIKLPSWVPKPSKKQGKPKAKKEGGEQPAAVTPAAGPAETPAAEAPAEEKPAEAAPSEEASAEEKPADETASENPTEDKPAE